MFAFWLIVDLIIIVGHSILLAIFANPLIEKIRDKYFEKIKKDLKQNTISEEIVNKVRGISTDLQRRYWIGFFWGGISSLVVAYIIAPFQPEEGALFANFVLLGITQINGIRLWCSIDNMVEGMYESIKCPHCNAPLSYFLMNRYNTDEFHFKKTVEHRKYTPQSRPNGYYYEYVPMVEYTVNEVFQCNKCHAKDTKRHKEQIEEKYYELLQDK